MKCTKCNKPLTENKAIWLLKHRDGKYYFIEPTNPIPAEDIVSKEPYGKDCAWKIGNLYKQDEVAKISILARGYVVEAHRRR